jgi:uncharacterized protein (DUF305 family)
MSKAGWVLRGVVAGCVIGILTSAASAVAQDKKDAPIIKPGAPGQASKELTVEQSLELGQSHYTDADVAFMQHMIVHHAQAVEMGALIEARTTHAGIRAMGERIALTQASEMEMMRKWLTRRGHPTEMQGMHEGHQMKDHDKMHGDEEHHDMAEHGKDKHDHDKHDHGEHGHGNHDMKKHDVMEAEELSDVPLMHGMLSPRQMHELAMSSGKEFDRLFLSGMIMHHQGAIDMVDALLTNPGAGEDPEISEFIAAVVADQSAEILRMRSMLSALDETHSH